MHNRFRLFSVSCALAAATVLAACSSPPKPIYQQEQFDATSSPYAHTFHSKSDATCEAARRALLSQGYVISKAGGGLVQGAKSFQPEGEVHVEISFHVVCVGDGPKQQVATAYVSAQQDRYALKKNPQAASLGVSALGSISVPLSSTQDSLVKVASETIPAGEFYDRFFTLMQRMLRESAPDR